MHRSTRYLVHMSLSPRMQQSSSFQRPLLASTSPDLDRFPLAWQQLHNELEDPITLQYQLEEQQKLVSTGNGFASFKEKHDRMQWLVRIPNKRNLFDQVQCIGTKY